MNIHFSLLALNHMHLFHFFNSLNNLNSSGFFFLPKQSWLLTNPLLPFQWKNSRHSASFSLLKACFSFPISSQHVLPLPQLFTHPPTPQKSRYFVNSSYLAYLAQLLSIDFISLFSFHTHPPVHFIQLFLNF